MADPEKIGKYQILERIGRGGMGTIFKAHDPILNRPVALKVISTDVEVTDEIRARFFREAQACARLSHPNIVTVYDMGEDDGRLFIVMELLEGVELRRLITDRAPLALEDKLAIMEQVCSGLYFAHQRGIVHRDIKPANIILLANDQVKILDFGIAQIENLQGTLTRTGLIMGTLRYMAPEQLRGRVDHRTDIFAVGTVCYEFLCLQPPYDSKDTLQLLEQVRTEDPTPLHLVDSSIPAELSDIIARAMRKDPQERFADLKQMRLQVEHVHRTLADEAARVTARIQTQRDQLQQLHAELADRMGGPVAEVPPMVDEPARLAPLRTLEVDLAARIEAARGMLTQAETLAPAFERGCELLRTGQSGEAIAAFEAIVAAMPTHGRAADGLAQARERADAERRAQIAEVLVRDARSAVEASEYTRGLEILHEAAAIPPPAEALPEIASLREAAETAVAARSAARQARQQAEEARAQSAPGRSVPSAEVHHAPELWQAAQTKFIEAEAAFARSEYAEAQQAFGAATAAYQRLEEATTAKRQERDAAGRAREAQQRQGHPGEVAVNQAGKVPGSPPPLLADASVADLDTELTRLHLEDPVKKLPRPADEGSGPRTPDRRRKLWIPGTIVGVAVFAAIVIGISYWRSPRDESRPEKTPVSAVPQPSPSTASKSAALPGKAEVAVVQSPATPTNAEPPGALTGQSSAAPSAGIGASTAQSATAPSAGVGASTDQSPAASSAGVGASTRSTAQPPAAPSGGVSAGTGQDEPAKTSPERLAKVPPAGGERGGSGQPEERRQDAMQAQAQTVSARQAAERAAASFYVPKLLGTAEAKEREGAEALRRSDYTSAIRLLGEARSIYRQAANEASRTADAQRQTLSLRDSVDEKRGTTLARRQEALAVDAERFAEDLFRAAEAKHTEADALAKREDFAGAARAYAAAAAGYVQATAQAKAAGGSK